VVGVGQREETCLLESGRKWLGAVQDWTPERRMRFRGGVGVLGEEDVC